MLNRLIKYTGVDTEPAPGVWGLYDKVEAGDTLSGIYENTKYINLLKKYAEVANKSVLVSLSQVELGKFLALNGLILKAKKAHRDRAERDKKQSKQNKR